jgi:hypothetical protein
MWGGLGGLCDSKPEEFALFIQVLFTLDLYFIDKNLLCVISGGPGTGVKKIDSLID